MSESELRLNAALQELNAMYLAAMQRAMNLAAECAVLRSKLSSLEKEQTPKPDPAPPA